MKKSQLIKDLAYQEGLTIKEAELAVNTFWGSIADALVEGDRAEIRGFGSFKVKSYDGYSGRNPKTGEVIEIQPKRLPAFKIGKELKERVDS